MEKHDLTACHVIISGKVQGVGFRYHTEKQASQLRLTGWVRNLANGDVEAYAEGPEKLVKKFLEWCHQGPDASKVEKVEILKNDHIEKRLDIAFIVKR